MFYENGNWYMNGTDASDPSCIRTCEELELKVEAYGFLPFFSGAIPGFSVEEMTDASAWWTGDPETDPWEWREIIARGGRIAYGKFFDGKAGFISGRWFPVFANYRRDGYDFDSRWDDELASVRQKKIMDLFMDPDAQDTGRELMSTEIRAMAGFGKGGEKNFQGTLTTLQMLGYLICCDFRQRLSKKGEPYGWYIAVYSTPEHVFGRDAVTSCYDEEPRDSLNRIKEQVRRLFPEADDRQILKTVGFAEDRPKGKNPAYPYPLNLLHAVDRKKDPYSWTKDQISGLYVALAQLQTKQQRTLRLRYLEGMTNEETGARMNRAPGTISTYHTKAMRRLRSPLVAAWYQDGYRENLKACAKGRGWHYPESCPEDEISSGDYCIRIGIKVVTFEKLASCGILTVGDLAAAMQNPGWYKKVPGVGPKGAGDLEDKMRYFHFLS